MTAVIEHDTNTKATGTDEQGEKKRGRKAGAPRDFTKAAELHRELAAYINTNPQYIEAGLAEVSPEQVRAVLLLRADYGNTPEAAEQREARKVIREAEKAKYDGMTAEQIKGEKAAVRAEKQAAKLEARIAEIKAKAEALRNGTEATGADLVAADTDEPVEEKPKRERRFGRSRNGDSE